ncbi:MAG: hypothetical protein EXS09_11175 [Gemmataceae bacterium]|nr:hypothetical protein [Gemmataceae bacterium]
MSDHDSQEKDLLLATAIASGATISMAASQLDISRFTVQKRMADPAFRKLISDLRGEMVANALGRMSENLTRAADAVTTLLDAPEPHIRLRAARLLFIQTAKLRDSVDFDNRLLDLEATVVKRLGGTP